MPAARLHQRRRAVAEDLVLEQRLARDAPEPNGPRSRPRGDSAADVGPCAQSWGGPHSERCRLPRMNQPAKAITVTIIGAGLGGIALVANLGLLGYRLRLHDRDEARIAKVRERGGSCRAGSSPCRSWAESPAWHAGHRRSHHADLHDAPSRLPFGGTESRAAGPGRQERGRDPLDRGIVIPLTSGARASAISVRTRRWRYGRHSPRRASRHRTPRG